MQKGNITFSGTETTHIREASFDGGGAFCVLQAVWAREIERATGKPFADHFHVMSGTSGGGLNAIALSLGKDGKPLMSANDLVNLYLTEAARIFDRSLLRKAWTAAGLIAPLYSPQGRSDVIREVTGNRMLSDLSNNLIIVATNKRIGRDHLFKSWHARGEFVDAVDRGKIDPAYYDFRLQDVAMATSALPVGFRSHVCQNVAGERFILADGGLARNNPVNIAVSSARRLYGIGPRHACFSFGSGYVPQDHSATSFEGLLHWAPIAIPILLSASSAAENYEADIAPDVDLARFDTIIEQKAQGMRVPNSSLRDGSREQILALIELGEYVVRREMKAEFEEAIRFLGTPKTPDGVFRKITPGETRPCITFRGNAFLASRENA